MTKSREHITNNGRAVFYASIWPDIRDAALDCGWALALHGSLSNDMDIMAMPWTTEAIHPLEMILKLKKCFSDSKIDVTETPMPNNRMVYTLSIWADFYLDINIIQPVQQSTLLDEVKRLRDMYKTEVDSLIPNDTNRYKCGVIDEENEFIRMLNQIINNAQP